MIITSDMKYIGVNDHTIDLFEGMYKVPNGVSYNYAAKVVKEMLAEQPCKEY